MYSFKLANYFAKTVFVNNKFRLKTSAHGKFDCFFAIVSFFLSRHTIVNVESLLPNNKYIYVERSKFFSTRPIQIIIKIKIHVLEKKRKLICSAQTFEIRSLNIRLNNFRERRVLSVYRLHINAFLFLIKIFDGYLFWF